MSEIFSPSDLTNSNRASEFDGSPVRVGGRVMHVTAEQLILSDAFGAIQVQTSGHMGTSPGDLLVCRVLREASNQWMLLGLEEVVPCPEPRGDGEMSRTGGRQGAGIGARSRAYQAIRGYFESAHFVEVETPTFVPSPGLDAHVQSLGAVVRGDRVDHLITSPEFHMKRLLVGGMPRIFQVARCFRAEELGDLHEPEFTLLEWYRAFATWRDVVADTEALVRRVFGALGNKSLSERPFDQLTVREAFHRFADIDDSVALSEADPDRYFELLIDRVEPELKNLGHPVFLTHYPLSQAALAQPSPDDPTTAERFELYVDGVELSNGYGELTDAKMQRKRFEAEQRRREGSSEPVYPIDERLLSALSEGLPPCSGNALGVDRLIAVALNRRDIASTLSFPDSAR